MGILFESNHHGDSGLQTFNPSGDLSRICLARSIPSDQAIKLQDNNVKRLLEFENEMNEKFESGLDTTDCRCAIISPFFIIECNVASFP